MRGEQVAKLTRHVARALAVQLFVQGLALPDGLVELAFELLLLLGRKLLGSLPVVVVEALPSPRLTTGLTGLTGLAVSAFPLALLLLLLEQVVDLLGVHTLVLQVIEDEDLAVTLGQGDERLLRVEGHDHEVDHVVRGDVGQSSVLLEQLAPHSELAKGFMHGLMQHDEVQFALVEPVHEALTVVDVAPVGHRRWTDAVRHNLTLADHEDARPQSELRVTHQGNVRLLETPFSLGIRHCRCS